MNKGQRQPLSQLAINSKCAEDVLNTPNCPKTRTVGQEEATTPQTIARSASTPEWLVDAFNMAPTPKLESHMKISAIVDWLQDIVMLKVITPITWIITMEVKTTLFCFIFLQQILIF